MRILESGRANFAEYETWQNFKQTKDFDQRNEFGWDELADSVLFMFTSGDCG